METRWQAFSSSLANPSCWGSIVVISNGLQSQCQRWLEIRELPRSVTEALLMLLFMSCLGYILIYLTPYFTLPLLLLMFVRDNVNWIFRLPLISTWMTREEFTELYFQTMEQANSSTRQFTWILHRTLTNFTWFLWKIWVSN